MKEFPDFMRNPVNAVSSAQQSKGMDGYIFDGIDGSQMIIWYFSHDEIHSKRRTLWQTER